MWSCSYWAVSTPTKPNSDISEWNPGNPSRSHKIQSQITACRKWLTKLSKFWEDKKPLPNHKPRTNTRKWFDHIKATEKPKINTFSFISACVLVHRLKRERKVGLKKKKKNKTKAMYLKEGGDTYVEIAVRVVNEKIVAVGSELLEIWTSR